MNLSLYKNSDQGIFSFASERLAELTHAQNMALQEQRIKFSVFRGDPLRIQSQAMTTPNCVQKRLSFSQASKRVPSDVIEETRKQSPLNDFSTAMTLIKTEDFKYLRNSKSNLGDVPRIIQEKHSHMDLKQP